MAERSGIAHSTHIQKEGLTSSDNPGPAQPSDPPPRHRPQQKPPWWREWMGPHITQTQPFSAAQPQWEYEPTTPIPTTVEISPAEINGIRAKVQSRHLRQVASDQGCPRNTNQNSSEPEGTVILVKQREVEERAASRNMREL
ncbi:hypothetical protein N7541_011886 [Penicillium brevicompactum]|uniref:Uncharacterized protein n=1 Tax=Penicillium brevicompactum TaxID=5074 RepID=A0A9W9QRB7_PENBR|nr:hypothetical protein N7541_011886 [Penicillium brevicompactum]